MELLYLGLAALLNLTGFASGTSYRTTMNDINDALPKNNTEG